MQMNNILKKKQKYLKKQAISLESNLTTKIMKNNLIMKNFNKNLIQLKTKNNKYLKPIQKKIVCKIMKKMMRMIMKININTKKKMVFQKKTKKGNRKIKERT